MKKTGWCAVMVLLGLPAGLMAQEQAGSAPATGPWSFEKLVWSAGMGFRFVSPVNGKATSTDPRLNAIGLGGYLAGPSVEWSQTYQKTRPGKAPLFFEWAGGLSWATGTTTMERDYPDGSGLFLSSGSMASTTVSLVTSGDATGAQAVANVTWDDGAGGTTTVSSSAVSPSGTGAAISQFAFSPTAEGGIYVALTTNGDAPRAAAYGLVYDSTGFGFFGVGDVQGSTVSSTTRENLFLTRQQFTFGTSRKMENGWSLATRAGPTLIYMDRGLRRNALLRMTPVSSGLAAIPDISTSQRDRIRSGYLGAVLGGSVTGSLNDTWFLDLSLDLGVTRYRADRTGKMNILVGGTDVSGDVIFDSSRAGTAYVGQFSINLVKAYDANTILRLGIGADYISDVPYVRTAGVGGSSAVVSNGSNLAFNGLSASNPVGELAVAPMWSPTLEVSFIKRF